MNDRIKCNCPPCRIDQYTTAHGERLRAKYGAMELDIAADSLKFNIGLGVLVSAAVKRGELLAPIVATKVSDAVAGIVAAAIRARFGSDTDTTEGMATAERITAAAREIDRELGLGVIVRDEQPNSRAGASEVADMERLESGPVPQDALDMASAAMAKAKGEEGAPKPPTLH